ncbi:MAG: UDP-N-acetylmuramate dehydrogenase [Bacteroidetes bacterium]|nr:UDP-N-acetylmuramate dehydrogenase [Bacteroidota bacterium]MCW5895155.1 UDP-N-acetylmuramate dehydrogenase [Bacteroidota bacterium]
MTEFRENIPLASLTTFKLGGNARYFAECRNTDEILAAIHVAESKKVRYHILGGGSNTIFPDDGFDGLVLKIASRGIQFVREPGSVTIVVAAGEQWDDFVRFCIRSGLAGVECLSGIPGLAGATPIQNVGAYGQEVAETIFEVKAIDRFSLRTVRFGNSECNFAYRRSRFNQEDSGRFIITEVAFRFDPAVQPEIRYAELQNVIASSVDVGKLAGGIDKLEAIRSAVLALRRKKSMVIDEADPNTQSAGSFFKNPVLTQDKFLQLLERCRMNRIDDSPPTFPSGEGVKVPAAWLLEKAGFQKGFRKGGVGVSANHTLALVNYGGTTKELLSLANEIQSAIIEKFGILLEREPVLVQ